METQALRDSSSMTSHRVSKKTMEVNLTHIIGRSLELKSRQDLHGHSQQQHMSSQHQLTKQSTHQERGGERKKERDQEGRKEEERKVEERGSERVKKDAMDWTVVTRKKKRKTVQIFVTMDGSKVTPMEVSLSDDKVEDVIRRVQNDQDAYVTLHGRVLKRGEKLRSCEVTDGCTVQITSKLRGGGKHKDKKGQRERKRAAKPQGPEQKSEEGPKRDKGPVVQECDRDAAIRMIEESEETRKMMVRKLEENEDNRKMIESICEGSDAEVEQALENYRTAGREVLGWDQGQADLMERGFRWAVEARRTGRRQQEEERREEQEQRRQEEQEEEQRRQEEQEEQRREEQEQRRQEQQEETRAESTDEPEVTSKLVEVRTGRGSAGLVRGGDGRHLADESNRTGKGKGNVGKVSMEAKEECRSRRRNTVGTRRRS